MDICHILVKSVPFDNSFPVTEFGEIITGRKPGREINEQVTVCDLTGTGIQVTAIAIYAFENL